MSYAQLPWIEKHRPNNLSQMVDHREKITTLRKLIKNDTLPHLLLYGVPGSGKTSLILAAARELYGPNFRSYILELNASDHRGIDIVRYTITDFVKVKSDNIRFVILDEVDAMTHDAQRALRRVMDDHAKNSRFCLICNDITRINRGVQSRCLPLRFGILDRNEIRRKLDQIIEIEGVRIEEDAIDTLLRLNQDFRQILNALQCIHYISVGISGDAGGDDGGDGDDGDDDGGSDDDSDDGDGDDDDGDESGEVDYPPITSQMIYNYLGKPTDEEVDEIYKLLFENFTKSYNRLTTLFRQNKWNLPDLIENVSKKVISDDDLNVIQRYYILKNLSKIEYRVVNGRESEIQLAALVSSFQLAQGMGEGFEFAHDMSDDEP